MFDKEDIELFIEDMICACGCPDEGADAFREVLDIFEPRTNDRDRTIYLVNLDKFKLFEKKHGDGFAYLMLYWLNAFNIAEHGGSVIGSWFTPLGEKVYHKMTVENFTPHNESYE